ncbi:1891_t:CDS:1, partial [Paraglomus brasilianum]
NLFEIAKENDEIAAAISEILDAFPDPMKKELPSLLQDDERYCTYNKEFLTTTTSIQSLTEKA